MCNGAFFCFCCQDWNVTWYTSKPDLTQCFQHTVLVCLPCVFLWTFCPLYLLYLHLRPRRQPLPLSLLCCTKTLLSLSLASLSLLEIFYLLVKKNDELHTHAVFLLGPLVRSFTFVLSVVVVHVERRKGTRSSVLLFLFWTLLVLCTVPPLKVIVEQILDQSFWSDGVRFVAFFICFSLQVIQVVLSGFSDRRPLGARRVENPCPEEDASFLSNFFFFWFSGLVIRGFRRPLQADDLWTLRDQDSSERIMSELEAAWTQKRAEQRRPSATSEKSWLLKKPPKKRSYISSFLRALGRSFGPYFLTGTLCLLLHDAFMFAVPQVLSLLLGFMRDEDPAMWKGFLFAGLLFLLSCLQSLLNHQYMYRCFTLGMRLKSAVMALVYRKCLVMSSAARRQCTVGEVINLISVDTQKMMDFVVYVNSVWVAPIEIALCFYFLSNLLGLSALAGIGAVILIFPLNGLIAKLRSKLQEVQLDFMDGRIKLMNEIVSGVKILKFYAWENAFLRRVGILRDGELEALKKSQVLYSVSLASFNSSSFLIAFAVFAVYVLIDERNVLDAQKIFVSVALINILKTPLSQLPFAMSTTLQAFVSLRRLGNFLCQDELNSDNVEKLPLSDDGDAVLIQDGHFAWCHDGAPCLQGINLKVKSNTLVAVVGHVGSGKSSLLSAILGEMARRRGSVLIRGSVAYVPQQAWIQNATLEENILFGLERKESWYHRVLEACALLPDLELLPAGDATEIGEKGLNLSGGQKQRISLARAVYRKSDVYLLDDPLSAVDAHVGQHIFDRVIGPKGLLKSKTRVLVTHSLSLLSRADLVLVMEDGRVSEMGSYSQLLERKGAFAKLIDNFSGNQPRESSAYKRVSRKSLSRLSFTDYSIDLSQEQLISCDMSGASVQVVGLHEDLPSDCSGKLTQPDKAHVGRVKLQVYGDYFRTVGLSFIMTIVFLCAFQQAASLAYSYWLSLWADDRPVNGTQMDHMLRLGVFGALGLTQGLAMFGTTLAVALGGIVASRHLHADLLYNVLRSPMSFFETTPSGNLLNRFSKEIDAIDCMIPEGLKMMLGYLFKLLEVCIIVLVATPFSGLVLLPLACLYVFIQSFYVAASCQLRRLEAVSRSPIYSHFNETVQGVCVIRAFGEQKRFVQQAQRRIDKNQEAYFPRFVATRWLAVNLEFLGNLLVLAAAILSVRSRDELSPGVVGLALSHSLQVTGILSWIVRSWTDVENNIVSVERVQEYANTPKEAAWLTENNHLTGDWPTTGSIQFEDYGLQYRKGLDWALKGISVNIQDKEKVGIVGRTGAGKSSLALAIFRILEAASGRIYIDEVDIAQLGLRDLRSRITIIPQDPVLFSGSLRMNLDPFDDCSDEELWRALELAHLSAFVRALPDKLQHQCCEGGENLSVGQRQLLCLARALLRKSKILLLDEATAAVDLEMDQLIQSTIRTHFNHCTVLTIAHRLNTVMDCNRIMVMERGAIVEVDAPARLIQQQGHFYQMCHQAGLV
ncbi:multidrug resistance-associated protein 1-like [Hippocampus zosterae]|uniref:multidrug resistance-associated protein 1-like n=1 Tax=Hippocampus zosterae TaxID=109293 RepID=UPI00223DDCE1|nr:multidrug resistance-associated protein 1-like [Hippocampus zosterae]